MRRDEIIDQVKGMNLSEKLLLVEDIWDAIAAENAEIPMPEWQKQELDKRYREYLDGRMGLHDWSSVHEELRDKYK